MEGVIRWFQSLSSSSSSNATTTATNTTVDSSIDKSMTTREQTQLEFGASRGFESLNRRNGDDGRDRDDLKITVDFSITGLKPIRVPDRMNYRAPPMDPNKVAFFFSVSISFFFCGGFCL